MEALFLLRPAGCPWARAAVAELRVRELPLPHRVVSAGWRGPGAEDDPGGRLRARYAPGSDPGLRCTLTGLLQHDVSLRRSLKALGRGFGALGEDPWQLPATYLLDDAGGVLWANRACSILAPPDLEGLLAAAATMGR